MRRFEFLVEAADPEDRYHSNPFACRIRHRIPQRIQSDRRVHTGDPRIERGRGAAPPLREVVASGSGERQRRRVCCAREEELGDAAADDAVGGRRVPRVRDRRPGRRPLRYPRVRAARAQPDVGHPEDALLVGDGARGRATLPLSRVPEVRAPLLHLVPRRRLHAAGRRPGARAGAREPTRAEGHDGAVEEPAAPRVAAGLAPRVAFYGHDADARDYSRESGSRRDALFRKRRRSCRCRSRWGSGRERRGSGLRTQYWAQYGGCVRDAVPDANECLPGALAARSSRGSLLVTRASGQHLWRGRRDWSGRRGAGRYRRALDALDATQPSLDGPCGATSGPVATGVLSVCDHVVRVAVALTRLFD